LFEVETVELWATPLVLSTIPQASGRPKRPLFTHEFRRGTINIDNAHAQHEKIGFA